MNDVRPVRFPLAPGVGFHVASYQWSGPRKGLHTHAFAEITLVTRGVIKHEVNGMEEILCVGALFFARDHDVHTFVAIDPQGCELVNIAFDAAWLGEIAVFLDCRDHMEGLCNSAMPPRSQLGLLETEELAERMLSLSPHITNSRSGKMRAISLLAWIFATYFQHEECGTADARIPAWLAKLLAKLKEESCFLEGIAAFPGLTRKTQPQICRAFREYLGMRPTDYINQLRLDYGARLLAGTHDDVATVAYKSSFASVSHFYRLFKAKFGISPAQFRKALRPTSPTSCRRG